MTGNILDSQSHLFRWLFTFHSASRDSILQRSVHGQAAFWARGRVPEVHIRAQPSNDVHLVHDRYVESLVMLCDWGGV